MTTLTDYRFPTDWIDWKPIATNGTKTKALGGCYVDVRRIAQAMDQLVPGWASDIELMHTGKEYAAVCKITIDGVTRCDTGQGDTPMDASNQSFRRCAAQHGIGRYMWISLPQVWAAYDPQTKRFTPDGLQALRRSLAPRTNQSADIDTSAENAPADAAVPATQDVSTNGTEPDNPFAPERDYTVDVPMLETTRRRLHALGTEVYGAKQWEDKRHELMAPFGYESSNQLTEAQAQQVIRGMEKKKRANMADGSSLPAVAAGAANFHTNGVAA